MKRFIIKENTLHLNFFNPVDGHDTVRLMLYYKTRKPNNDWNTCSLNLYVSTENWKSMSNYHRFNLIRNLILDLKEGLRTGNFESGESYHRIYSKSFIWTKSLIQN